MAAPACGSSPNPGGGSTIETCECQVEQRAARLMKRAGIPTRYEHCSLDSYEASFPGADRSLAAAHLMARRFVDGYPATTGGRGLLLTGSIGVGKTHLAVGILQALIVEKVGPRPLLRLPGTPQGNPELLQSPGFCHRDGDPSARL